MPSLSCGSRLPWRNWAYNKERKVVRGKINNGLSSQGSMLVIYYPLFIFRGGEDSKCAQGYKGKLCSKCTGNINGTAYGRSSGGKCL